jgi:serine phosphatase RsbU (regulator of sigma subunit)
VWRLQPDLTSEKSNMSTRVVPEEAAGPASVLPPDAAAAAPTSRRRSLVHLSSVVVLLVGFGLTGVLALGAASLHDSNEDRLLAQRVKEAAAVVGASIPNIQTPLSSAAVLAEATDGDPEPFRGLMGPIVEAGRPFVSVSLWKAGDFDNGPVVVVGSPPELADRPAPEVRRFLSGVAGKPTISLYNLFDAAERRLGYAYTASTANPRYVVYGEASLPRDRRARVDRDSAFAGLGYALYLGNEPRPDNLLASSTGGALLDGRKKSTTVPFADSQLLVVMTPDRELGGPLMARLPWILALTGAALTIGVSALVERLSRRREQAEMFAGENARLYTEQRSVAQTLQHSLLPQEFPRLEGFEVAARYLAGVEGIDIGGDWYDVVGLEGGRVLVVVGDVSGRGLPAATMMASLRYAIRAYAAQGDRPATILTKLSALHTIARDGHFATVLCALVDLYARQLTIANAGHLEPLLVDATGTRFVATRVGPPVGVPHDAGYVETTVAVADAAALLLYTDGLIERRAEPLDVGLQRLKDAVEHPTDNLEGLLDNVVRALIPEGSDDDTALLGVQWHR